MMLVSIIIPTYNDLEKLPRALESIEKIDFSHDAFEVIVVDDGSCDGTGAYVAGLIDKVNVSLDYVYQENGGPAAARNLGIERARGEYILSIDSDCFVDEDILNRFLRHYPDETLGGVGGNVLPDSDNLIASFLDYMGTWRPGRGKQGVTYLVTANAFFLKRAVVEAGCFDEGFRLPGGEELDLCYRMRKLGYRFEYDGKASVVHAHRTTFRSLIRTFRAYGSGFARLVMKWPEEFRMGPFAVRIAGIAAFKKFFCDFLWNLKPHRAIIFLFLNYCVGLAYHRGYLDATRQLSDS
jgi:glycosyltransferase involved in cell wall biosynthesis